MCGGGGGGGGGMFHLHGKFIVIHLFPVFFGCAHWVHKKCSGVIGSLKSNPDYRCSRCKGTARPIDRRPHNEWLLMQDKKLDVVDSFCYLGDTIGAGGGCDLSVITRIRSAWGKFRELLPIWTSHALSYITRGQIYSTYIRTVLLYASECWAPNVNDLLKLRHNDRAMILWTCNVRLKQTNKLYYDTIDYVGLGML